MSYKIALECLKKKMIYTGFKKLWIKISNTKGNVNYEDHFTRLNLWASDLLMVPSSLHGCTDCPFFTSILFRESTSGFNCHSLFLFFSSYSIIIYFRCFGIRKKTLKSGSGKKEKESSHIFLAKSTD